MPDVFIPIDTTANSKFLSEVIYNGMINQFSFDYADGHRAALEKYGSAEDFEKKFNIDETLFNSFLSYAESEKLSPTLGELKRSNEELKMRLKAGIARVIWGEKGYFTVYLKGDKEFKAAMEYGRSN